MAATPAGAGTQRRRRVTRITKDKGANAVIFETLNESAQRGELLLIDGGLCHWHLRRDTQLTIREIISTRRGAGSEMLSVIKSTAGASSIFAKCPEDLPANGWYKRRGFDLEGEEVTRSGRVLKLWRLQL